MEELRGQNGTLWYRKHSKSIYKWFFKYKWVIYMVRQSVLNPYRMCLDVVDLASVAWRRGFVNPTGRNFWKSTHKNLVETYNFFEICVRDLFEISSSNLVEILIIILHLIYCMIIRKLVEIVSYNLVETCQHMHTYIASSRDMCYHMYIHIEITVTHINTLMCLYHLLDIDWACSDRYIHTSIPEWELRDVLWQFGSWHIS